MANDRLMFVGQKAFIEKDGKVLVLIDNQNRVDFPGGKIQDGETDYPSSLKREVKEETNLEISIGDPFTTWHFELGPEHRSSGHVVYLIGFKCKYVSGDVSLSNEHGSYRWITKDDMDNFEFPKDKHYYALEKYFIAFRFYH